MFILASLDLNIVLGNSGKVDFLLAGSIDTAVFHRPVPVRENEFYLRIVT